MSLYLITCTGSGFIDIMADFEGDELTHWALEMSYGMIRFDQCWFRQGFVTRLHQGKS